jgi:hypothetical protein
VVRASSTTRKRLAVVTEPPPSVLVRIARVA